MIVTGTVAGLHIYVALFETFASTSPCLPSFHSLAAYLAGAGRSGDARAVFDLAGLIAADWAAGKEIRNF